MKAIKVTLEKVLKHYLALAQKLDKETEAVKLLIMELSNLTPHEFYLNQQEKLSDELTFLIDEAVSKYLYQDIPIQHILGFSYFYGYQFKVSEHVLIPRRETEELVEHILYIYDHTFKGKEVRVLDLGCGSGCIGITLSLEALKMKVDAADISLDALKVARENNERLGSNVSFIHSNWFDQIDQKYDMIVSNPPYLPQDEFVEEIVKKEPAVALFGGPSGLDAYDIILKNATKYLKERGLIAFEHGYHQDAAIKALAIKYLEDPIIIQKKDLQGKNRMTFIGIGGILKDYE